MASSRGALRLGHRSPLSPLGRTVTVAVGVPVGLQMDLVTQLAKEVPGRAAWHSAR